MARVPDLIAFCKEHRLIMITVADLIRHRMAHERSIHRKGAAVPPTSFGEFSMIAYGADHDRESHVALVHGDVACSETWACFFVARLHIMRRFTAKSRAASTSRNRRRALDRAGLKAGNKYFEAAAAAIEMVSLHRKIDTRCQKPQTNA